MKSRPVIPAACFAMLGISTFWLTSTLIGQARTADAIPGPNDSPAAPSQALVAAARGAPPSVPVLEEIRKSGRRVFENPPAHVKAAFALRGFRVKVVGHQVSVSQTVEIMEKRPGYRFFWSFVVMDYSNRSRILLERPYFNQIFAVPGGHGRPTFNDTATLPPGKYYVEVRLYKLPPGVAIDQFRDPSYAESQQSITGCEVVTVPTAP